MAENEAASREFNEEIDELHHGEPPSKRLDIVCECALSTCDRTIDITMSEYQLVRNDPLQFAIVADHLIGDIERIVMRTTVSPWWSSGRASRLRPRLRRNPRGRLRGGAAEPCPTRHLLRGDG